MKNCKEVDIKDKTNVLINRLVCVEREYWATYKMELTDENRYRQINAVSKAIERAINKFQEEYELPDAYINSIVEYARDTVKYEMRI